MGVGSDPFVGRTDALARLEAAVGASEGGVVTGALVLGPAGIGKSTLAERAAELARARGHRVVVGRAFELSGAPPFWPWIHALEGLAPDADGAEVAAALDRLRPVEGRAAGPEQRFVQFESVRHALQALSRERPLAVVLDDVHAADAPTLLLARHVLRHAAPSRLLILLCARDAPAEAASPEVADLLADLARSFAVVPLRGLPPAEVRRLAEALAGASLPEAAAARLAEATGGNPFFVREIVSSARNDGALDALAGATLPIPRTVSAAIDALAGRLGPRSLAVFRAAAVLGRASPVAVVARVSGEGESAVLDALAEAHATGLARRDEQGRFFFIHALVCDALAADLPPARSLALHAAAAEAWAASSTTDAAVRDAAAIHHACCAAPLGPEHRRAAVEACRRGGSAAMRSLAWEEAVRMFERAVGLQGEDDPGTLVDLLCALARAATAAGRPPVSKAALERAIPLAEALGEADRSAEVALAAAASREFMFSDPARLRLLERAAEGLTVASPLRVRVLSRLARDLGMDPASRPRRDALSQQAVDLARSLGEPEALARALDARLHALYSPESVEERREHGATVTAIARELGDPELEIAGAGWQLSALIETGALAEAGSLAAHHAALAASFGAPGPRINSLSRRAALRFVAGEWDEGHALALEARRVGREGGDPGADLLFAAQVSVPSVLAGRGEVAAAELAELDAGVARAYTPWLLRSLGAWVRLHLGRRDEAGRELEALAARGFSEVPQDFVRVATLCLLADLACSLGDEASARALRPLLLPWCGRNATAGTSFFLGSASLFLGRLHRALGDADAAAEALRRAVDHNRAMGARPFEALALGDLGPAGRPARPVVVPAADVVSMRREGDVWALSRAGGLVVRLKHQRGLELLARVVAAAGAEVLAFDLAGSVASPEREALRGAAGVEVADARALGEVRARLADLAAELDEAERDHDLGRAGRLRSERDALVEYVGSAAGLGGRRRQAGDAGERARVAVTVAIGRAVRAIEAAAPDVGAHLRAAVRTGATCRYEPDPSARLRVTT